MKQCYWFCMIGPTDQGALPKGADTPLRKVVEGAYAKMTGTPAAECNSGWGVTEEERETLIAVIVRDADLMVLIKEHLKRKEKTDDPTNGATDPEAD